MSIKFNVCLNNGNEAFGTTTPTTPGSGDDPNSGND